MFQGFRLKTDKHKKTIFSIRLILLFTIFILFQSCMPRSVRHGANDVNPENIKYSSNNKETVKNNKTEDNKIKEIEEFAAMIEKNKNNEFKDNSSNADVSDASVNEDQVQLPSLRSQIAKLSDNQQATDEKVQLMQSQLDDIKTELGQIKQAIMDLDRNKEHTYSKGIPTREQKNEDKKEEYIIKPDSPAKPRVKKVNNIQSVKKEEVPEILNIPSNEQLTSGKKAYETGDFDEAIQKLEELVTVLSSQDEKGEAHFYLGESYFAKNEYIPAIEHYKKVIAIERAKQKDKAQHQIAESYVKTGDINSAKTAYSELLENYPKSRYIPKAKKMLQQL